MIRCLHRFADTTCHCRGADFAATCTVQIKTRLEIASDERGTKVRPATSACRLMSSASSAE